jgi:hypothetical protein
MKDPAYVWLLFGAAAGVVAVTVVEVFFQLPLPAWTGALVPTLAATVSSLIGPGPRAEEADTEEPRPGGGLAVG